MACTYWKCVSCTQLNICGISSARWYNYDGYLYNIVSSCYVCVHRIKMEYRACHLRIVFHCSLSERDDVDAVNKSYIVVTLTLYICMLSLSSEIIWDPGHRRAGTRRPLPLPSGFWCWIRGWSQVGPVDAVVFWGVFSFYVVWWQEGHSSRKKRVQLIHVNKHGKKTRRTTWSRFMEPVTGQLKQLR